MVSVTIYVEGGGESKQLRTLCREGFNKLIKNLGFEGRMPKIVAGGGREKTYDMFNNCIASARIDEFPILLVDSEDPITSGPWDHLKARDNWNRPVGVQDDQAQMMATCMETWIMADHETLRNFFGSCLRERTLIQGNDLENRSRKELLEALESATNNCGRNRGYKKGMCSFQILAKLNPRSLERNLPYFCRFKETLDRHLPPIRQS
jgi:hypothetical protein